MPNNSLRTILCLGMVLLTACGTPPAKQDYSAFKASKPRSILVLPPVNNAPDIKGSNGILSQTTLPLAEAGYYVIPVGLMHETFKQNGFNTPHDIQAIPKPKLREIFGADAAVYITISQYGASYNVLSSSVDVAVKAELVDLRSGKVLFNSSASASSREKSNGGSGNLAAMLIEAAVRQVINDVTDSGYEYAGVATQRLLRSGPPNGLLYGPYSPKYGTD